MTNYFRSVTSFLLLVFVAASALAHDTWLIPDRFAIEREASVFLDLTSGMAFPALETSIKPERIDRAVCRLSKHQFNIRDYSPAPNSLRFKAKLFEPGIATFFVELKPRALELTPSQVHEYLDEIGASESIRKLWASAKRPKRWREIYVKHSKTFVKVGQPQEDRSWAEPVGMFLEIIPEKDPTTLNVGDELPVRVLKGGTPVDGFPVGIVREGSRTGQIIKTDTQGRVTFRLDKSGRWLLRATELRKATKAGIEWESDFTTLTIQVGSM